MFRVTLSVLVHEIPKIENILPKSWTIFGVRPFKTVTDEYYTELVS